MELIKFDHLKTFTSKEGYWHTVGYFDIAKDIINTTNINSMLEIGFNIGYSANIWLQSGIDRLYIIDINFYDDTIPALQATMNFPDYDNKEIRAWIGDSTSVLAYNIEDFENVECTFIDGYHNYINVLLNSYLAINYGSKYIVYDDVHKEMLGDHVYKAILKLESLGLIELVKEYPRILENDSVDGFVSLYKVRTRE